MNQNNQMKMPQTGIVPEVKGPAFNDRDIVNDCLFTEKYLTYGYNVSANEASHPQLEQLIRSVLNRTHDAQFELFQKMYQVGWYTLEAAETNKIAQDVQQFTGYLGQFPQVH